MRAAIYYRVSSEEQLDGFSLDAQKRVLLDYCAAKGWPAVEAYADEGKSARGDKIEQRPAFKRMMEDAEDGAFDVVVVHRIDRFARNIRVTFECLERLARRGVAFVAAAQPDLDYTRPEGRLFMGMMATLAQYYSDNLSQETKKGKTERKNQGYHNGRIPWGMMRGEDGIAIPNPATLPGLRLAFELAAAGQTDREIAQGLNAAGCRTNGPWGDRPFSKDTVRAMLRNRFYLGELPGRRPADAAPAKHAAVIERDLWVAAQDVRERRAVAGRATINRDVSVYSLSGLGVCAYCGSKLQAQPNKGKPRLVCSGRRQVGRCRSRSAFLQRFEEQLVHHLKTFTIPADYLERLRAAVASELPGDDDTPAQRRRLEKRLARLKDLYQLGDIERDEYLAERERIKRELATLLREEKDDRQLGALADLLGSVARGWERATQEQRNRLARLLFAEVVIKDDQVVAVKPQPELAGFFALDRKERGEHIALAEVMGITLSPALHARSADAPLYPLAPPEDERPAPAPQRRPRLDPALWPEIAERARYESLRDLAAAYGVSHETVRAIVRRVMAGAAVTALAAD